MRCRISVLLALLGALVLPAAASAGDARPTDVAISQRAAVSQLSRGGSTTLIVRVVNAGDATAAHAAFDEILPPDLVPVSAAGDDASCQLVPFVFCDFGDLPPGAHRTAAVVVRATRRGIRPAIAKVLHDGTDSDSSDDSIQTDLQVGVCLVPRLRGLTVAQARTRLRAAGCAAGSSRTPPGRGRLVVASSHPGAGAVRGPGARVALVLSRKR